MIHDVLGDGISGISLVKSVGTDIDIVNSARVSFGKHKEELDAKDIKLIKYLWEHGHTSTFEHGSMTFRVKAPIFVARQWMRSRIASYNEVSARYTEVKDEFYIPTKFRKQSANNRQASIESNDLDNEKANLIYAKTIKEGFENYKELLALGVAREQARGVLPLTAYTEFYYTANLRSVLHFIKLRIHEGAQWEIQQYAKAMVELIEPLYPETMKIVIESKLKEEK